MGSPVGPGPDRKLSLLSLGAALGYSYSKDFVRFAGDAYPNGVVLSPG